MKLSDSMFDSIISNSGIVIKDGHVINKVKVSKKTSKPAKK